MQSGRHDERRSSVFGVMKKKTFESPVQESRTKSSIGARRSNRGNRRTDVGRLLAVGESRSGVLAQFNGRIDNPGYNEIKGSSGFKGSGCISGLWGNSQFLVLRIDSPIVDSDYSNYTLRGGHRHGVICKRKRNL